MQDDSPFENAADDTLSSSERLDRIIASLKADEPLRRALLDLRMSIAEQEDTISEARQTLEKMEQIIKKVTSPANRIGTFLGSPAKETAQIVVGGSDYYCNVDPRIALAKLKKGTRVLVNEAYVIVGDLGYDTGGPVVEDHRDHRPGPPPSRRRAWAAIHRSPAQQRLAARASSRSAMKCGWIRISASPSRSLPGAHARIISSTPCPSCRGKKSAASRRRSGPSRTPSSCRCCTPISSRVSSTPRRRVSSFTARPGAARRSSGKRPPTTSPRKLKEETGEEMSEYFMHIKGPEILNMWVGESERMVREIFATAREKRKEGFMPFLFIDEAESILGTRRASRYSNILSTLVPMFCTEMDGIDSLNEVVIILASNRADLIDPAILRPGRIDRKIKVNRPDKEAAREIYKIYLAKNLPYEPALVQSSGGVSEAIDVLVNKAIDLQFGRRDENRFLEVLLRSGRKDVLYRGDLVSGALIASVVERAKGFAIKRAIATSQEEGISESDLRLSLEAEYAENDIFPPTDITEDWLKLIDYDSENVVKVSPIRPGPKNPAAGRVI